MAVPPETVKQKARTALADRAMEKGAAVLCPYGSGRKKQIPHFVRNDN
jgi:hypothetical protein